MTIQWQRRGDHKGEIPARATPGAAGYDLRWHPHHESVDSIRIFPGEMACLPTGWAVRVPDHCAGLIRDRSGQAMRGLTTRAGVIDSDYRGEVGVIVTNETESPIEIRSGDRIAQIVFVKIRMDNSNEVEDLGGTPRGDGGFGSTGDE